MLPSLDKLALASDQEAANANANDKKEVNSSQKPHLSAMAAGQEGGSAQKPFDREYVGRTQQQSKPFSASTFEFGAILGEGSYSRVVKAKNLATGEICAIKVSLLSTYQASLKLTMNFL
jgi:serine/threonine protein kinase